MLRRTELSYDLFCLCVEEQQTMQCNGKWLKPLVICLRNTHHNNTGGSVIYRSTPAVTPPKVTNETETVAQQQHRSSSVSCITITIPFPLSPRRLARALAPPTLLARAVTGRHNPFALHPPTVPHQSSCQPQTPPTSSSAATHAAPRIPNSFRLRSTRPPPHPARTSSPSLPALARPPRRPSRRSSTSARIRPRR